MQTRRVLLRAASTAIIAGLVLPAMALAQTFNFGTMNGSGNLGTSEVFTLAGWGTITATASSGYDLWAKNGGTGETGLGVCSLNDVDWHSCETDTEIGNNSGFITLTLNPLAGVSPFWFELASVQTGEDWSYKQGSSCGGLGSSINGTGPNDGNATTVGAQAGGGNSNPFLYESLASTVRCLEFDPAYRTSHGDKIYDQGDYLLMSVTYNQGGIPQDVAPEPASMSLLATGLVGLVAAAKRRRRTSGI
jgi:hypothetical protein